MEIIIENYIKKIAIEQLMSSEAGEKIQKAIHILEGMQEKLYVFSEKQDESGMTGIKAMTILTFSVLKKIADGKKISEFTDADWKSISKNVWDYAVAADDQLYSILIFGMYEKYIRGSAEQMKEIVSPEVVDSIQILADELHNKSENLVNGMISEVEYTEDCLWICLEAMVKLIASITYLFGNKEISEFVQAVSIYAFEYGRMILYKKEQEIITQYMEAQYKLDKELEVKFANFLLELQHQAEQFSILINM